MSTEHPITPPPELVGEWLCDDGYPWDPSGDVTITITTNRLRNVATQAARWGADQELEACCEWLQGNDPYEHDYPQMLRTARRPKPLSLKQQAFDSFDFIGKAHAIAGPDWAIIRRALEALPDA